MVLRGVACYVVLGMSRHDESSYASMCIGNRIQTVIAEKDLDVLECFCGCQSICRGCEFLGGKAAGIDILSPLADSQPRRNIGHTNGFLLALRFIALRHRNRDPC